jgi:hypothetical protein
MLVCVMRVGLVHYANTILVPHLVRLATVMVNALHSVMYRQDVNVIKGFPETIVR